jgi:hypothetical protein
MSRLKRTPLSILATLLAVVALSSPLAAHTLRHHRPRHRPHRPDPRTLKIEAIVPALARPGDRVTIIGHGLGALSVRVTIDDVDAAVKVALGCLDGDVRGQ